MEQIIKKAIEGGWECQRYSFQNTMCAEIKLDGESYHKSIVLDPLFWQALGKTCGWKRYFEMTSFGVVDDIGYIFDEDIKEDFSITRETTPEWKYRALKFHEINLTEGWDKAVEYLEDLLTP